MAFTLLHTADLHLGKSFSALPPERAGQRRADLLATLGRICRRARELPVDLLCVAGDLFDCALPAPPLVAAARRALAEADVPVLLIPGNHDPLDSGSPYLEDRWPANVMVARQPGWQRMPVGGAEVWAFGYARGTAHRSPWTGFPGCGPDAILALHAACLAPSLVSEAGYYPFTPAEIPPCGYLALGHHHRPVQVSRTPVAWYAGTPEPLQAESAAPAVLQVRLAGASAMVETVQLATRRHRLEVLDLTGLSGPLVWERALALACTEDLLLLRLIGMLPEGDDFDPVALQAELALRCFAVEVDATALYTKGLPAGEGVMGALSDVMRERIAALPMGDGRRDRVERAARYAALALEGKL